LAECHLSDKVNVISIEVLYGRISYDQTSFGQHHLANVIGQTSFGLISVEGLYGRTSFGQTSFGQTSFGQRHLANHQGHLAKHQLTKHQSHLAKHYLANTVMLLSVDRMRNVAIS
jgi:hypothetical protein